MSLPIDSSSQQSAGGQTTVHHRSVELECSWVVPLRDSGARPPLFCACAGDGDGAAYSDLAAALPSDQPVYSFGLPALSGREQFPSVEQIAEKYVRKLRKIQKRGPYYLCGYSFGGLVVYEMALRLMEEGEQIGLLALLDTEHPSYSQTLPSAQRTDYYHTYLFHRLRKYGRNVIHGRIDQIVYDLFVLCRARCKKVAFRVFRAASRGLGWRIPSAFSSNELVLLAAWQAYRPPRYEGRLVLFNAAGRAPEYKADSTLGWKTCATGAIEVHVTPGDHHNLLRPPHARDFGERLTPHLGATVQPDGSDRGVGP
ncbi:thioesterase domain-containing protein [Methylocystis bryophila]|uniref:Thioesterase domain-containing protein n=1 Tax=Methylocystis bryophila TaxID=655015 RepID=A0A1W6MWM1_9HYPH|nr:thioesterase domain-containing protein [Methylocystis bryophila]ARN81988.1 hypothetical protein B1812_13865 [Methylocystis bryophila]BDV38093.1 hypothetical protein DSM21852_13460 [Methylocystis bryophila]